MAMLLLALHVLVYGLHACGTPSLVKRNAFDG